MDPRRNWQPSRPSLQKSVRMSKEDRSSSMGLLSVALGILLDSCCPEVIRLLVLHGEVIPPSLKRLKALTAGDDVVVPARASLYAGTPTVVSTLWRVVSETTEPLMVAFYGYLRQGLNKAESLRQAQLDVMATYPHPRYWAAFELMGDWR